MCSTRKELRTVKDFSASQAGFISDKRYKLTGNPKSLIDMEIPWENFLDRNSQ